MGVLLPEWSPRRALILRWPWRPDIWPHNAKPAQAAVIEALKRLQPALSARGVKLHLQATSEHAEGAREALKQASLEQVQLDIVPFADIWIRDCAPFYLTSPRTDSSASADNNDCWVTGFNGWDGLDPDFALELGARQQLCQQFHLTPQYWPAVLEGGSLHTDGEGLLLYVASSVLTQGRNPTLASEQLHEFLHEHFGARQIVALPQGLICDETGGHADNLLTFLDEQHYALCVAQDRKHPEFTRTQQIKEKLVSLLVDKTCIELPMPELSLSMVEAASIKARAGSMPRPAAMPLCSSYTNGIRIADLYAMPTFGVEQDQQAKASLQAALPDLTIIELPARDILPGGGGWHCASHTVV